jgi:small-conductance mechanosensitive channel
MISPVRIDAILQTESLLVLVGLSGLAWGLYKTVLRAVSDDRHRLLKRLFKNMLGHGIAMVVLFAAYRLLFSSVDEDMSLGGEIASRLYPYVGFFCILSASIFFVKTARILAFEYLFFLSMKAGVPVLLVNILSLGLSLGLAAWIATEVFAVRLAPVLATSALISVILGLALQDTLGNLFAGVSLQIDKPYEIGDWVKVQNGGQEWVGQIQEISWRSTLLLGLLDELITIPNRVIASSQVAAYGSGGKHFLRGINFRIPLHAPVERSKNVLEAAVKKIPGLPAYPLAKVYFNEVGDSWINLRLLLPLTDFGSQIGVVDRVHSEVFEAFAREGLEVATPVTRVDIIQGI